MSKDTAADLQKYLDSFIIKNKTPGIEYIVMNKDSIIFSHSSGLADVSKRTPFTLDCPVMIYSITKSFTATAIMQLVEKKKLSLDDSLQTILHWVPYHTTIGLMLCHSGGIPNPMIGTFYVHPEKNNSTFDKLAIIKSTCRKHSKLMYKPGTSTVYSNLGFALLGEVIQAKSGLTYEKYIEEYVLKPLEISPDQISFSLSSFPVRTRGYVAKYSLYSFIMGYLFKDFTVETADKWKTFRENWYIDCPAHGGIIASATGLSKYVRSIVSSDTVLLCERSKATLFTVQKPFRSTLMGSTGAAYAWLYNGNSKEPYYFIEGSAFGFLSEVRIYPESDIVSIISMNSTDRIHKKIMDAVDRNFISQ